MMEEEKQKRLRLLINKRVALTKRLLANKSQVESYKIVVNQLEQDIEELDRKIALG